MGSVSTDDINVLPKAAKNVQEKVNGFYDSLRKYLDILFQVTKMIRGVGGRVIGSVSTKTKETL